MKRISSKEVVIFSLVVGLLICGFLYWGKIQREKQTINNLRLIEANNEQFATPANPARETFSGHVVAAHAATNTAKGYSFSANTNWTILVDVAPPSVKAPISSGVRPLHVEDLKSVFGEEDPSGQFGFSYLWAVGEGVYRELKAERKNVAR